MDPETQAVAVQMLERAGKINRVQVLIEENGLLNKRSIYKPLDGTSSTDLDDFPHLSLDDLRNIAMGVNQVKQAPAYTKEHTDDDGGYELMACRDFPDLLRVKIQSRHSKNAVHTLWIQYTTDTGNIRGWYCTCKVGARVVGCCAHVASVLWFLGWKRHLPEEQLGKPGLASSCLNASSSSGTFSSNDPLEE
ncbi:uncharacterized protein LOC117317034 [Pecten maximus]|uniref:uncharacterized protein LOC117317034 n=1 Tax=Pecten maximus TaxID=6579 RepID=UPI00145835FB|nr:uncharacterized protein LOC117317034 [Pecten maximus]